MRNTPSRERREVEKLRRTEAVRSAHRGQMYAEPDARRLSNVLAMACDGSQREKETTLNVYADWSSDFR